MVSLRIICHLTAIVLFLDGCPMMNSSVSTDTKPAKENIIVTIGNEHLDRSEIEAMEQISPKFDKKEYIDRWIKNQIISDEAKRSKIDLGKINVLVEDYKNALLLDHYQDHYIQQNLKTNISTTERETYYHQNKASFVTQEEHGQFQFAQIEKTHDGVDNFKDWWKANNLSEIDRFCQDYGFKCITDRKSWIPIREIKAYLPEDYHDWIVKDKSRIKSKDDYQYFVKVFDLLPKGEQAPLDLVVDKIDQSIIFNRKKQLLINLQDSLYKVAIDKDRLKIYNYE